MTLNLVHLVGRAGRDPELKYFESGAVKGSFSLAVDRNRKAGETDWFELELWGKTAETAGNYVRKGKQIAVIGSLKFDHWNDKTTGEERAKPLILVDRLELLGSKRDDEGGSGGAYDADF
ncbi:MAG: single-stranded DNA-binding protein [Pseudanabaenaceae cyanobacterium]